MLVEVLKFGGSILKDGKDFERASETVVREIGQSRFPVCVVSAVSGVTERLIRGVEAAYSQKGFDPHAVVGELHEEHLKLAPSSRSVPEGLLDEFEKLKHVLSYVQSSHELSDSAYAFAVSRGENFSSLILSSYLDAREVPNRCFYGEDLVVTNSNSRDAIVDLERTRKRVESTLLPSLEKGEVPIVAGFAGRSVDGGVTILGRGGSDDTAVCLAYCLGVNRVVKYVHEDGIMTIDPKFVEEVEKNHSQILQGLGGLPSPGVISYLSYVEASELLREERTKVVHYKVLDALMKGSILLQIKNISKPEEEGTIIGPEEDNGYGKPKAISFQRGLYGIRFLPEQSFTPTEVYARVFHALSKEGVDVRYVSTSGYQVSLLLTQSDLEKALRALKGLDMAVDVAALEGRKGTLSLVGSGMRGVRGLLSRVTGTLASHGVNIEQAIQPNSENIIRFSVNDDDIPMAVCALYSEFFK